MASACNAVNWSPNLGVFAVRGRGCFVCISCVVDALPGQCLRRTPDTNSLVAAVFRTKRLWRERCSATCQRRRRPGQARRRQGRLQITAEWDIHLTGVAQLRGFALRRSDLGELNPQPGPMTFSYRSRSAYVNNPDRRYGRRRMRFQSTMNAARTGYLVCLRVARLTGATCTGGRRAWAWTGPGAATVVTAGWTPRVVVAVAARRAARARSSKDSRGGRDHGGAERDQGDLPARHAARSGHAAGWRLIWPVIGDSFTAHAVGMMAADDSRVQMTAARAAASPAQSRGRQSRGSTRMRSPAGKVCGHDGLLPVQKGSALAALTGRFAQAGGGRAGAGLPLSTRRRRPRVGLPAEDCGCGQAGSDQSGAER